jgi:hypothetical protein
MGKYEYEARIPAKFTGKFGHHAAQLSIGPRYRVTANGGSGIFSGDGD